MKLFFRSILFLSVLSTVVTASCKKDYYMANGIITGYDYRKCACCGGLMINFGNNTQPYEGQFKLIYNDPSELGISSTSTFPIYIKVDYETVSTCAGAEIIKIVRFKK